MYVFEKKIGKYIAASIVLLDRKGLGKYADVLRYGCCDLDVRTGYDGRDDGQISHTLKITVPLDVFESIADELVSCEESLRDKINVVSNDVQNESLEAVCISLDTENIPIKTGSRIKKGLRIKTAFDEYEIGGLLGEGGNGRVFSAKNGAGEMVAIKFLERDCVEKRQRFKNEIRFCETTDHPNIVKVLDRGCVELADGTRIFCVMPLYSESLRTKMKRGISPEDAVSIFSGLVRALGEAHKQNVLHRDVKPENIMFESNSLKPILLSLEFLKIFKRRLS